VPHFYNLRQIGEGIKNNTIYFKTKNPPSKGGFLRNKELFLRFFVSSALFAPLAILVELNLFSDEFLVLA